MSSIGAARAGVGGAGGGGLGDIIGQMTQGASTGGSTFDVQNYWEATLPGYRRATTVIFNDSVATGGCGNATSADL